MWQTILDWVNKDLKADWGDYNLASVKAWVGGSVVLVTTGVAAYLPKIGSWVSSVVHALSTTAPK